MKKLKMSLALAAVNITGVSMFTAVYCLAGVIING